MISFPAVAEAQFTYGLSAHELGELMDVAVEHIDEIRRFWNEHFAR
jgi:hypothetical protein